MSPFHGHGRPRDALKVHATPVVDTGYSPPTSSNGYTTGPNHSQLMEGEYPAIGSLQSQPQSSDNSFQRPQSLDRSILNVPRTPQALPPEFQAYLKLQDETTMLRVDLQQKRKEASRARQELADAEAKIEQALREASTAGYQISLNAYQQLLEVANQARNTLGPLEQEVDDFEFRLVSEEDRLIKDGLILQDLMSQFSRGQYSNREVDSYLDAPPSPPPFEQAGSHRASTEIFYEDDTSWFDGPIYDEDDRGESNLVDQYAPDLVADNALRPADPDRPDQIELYVPDSPGIDGFSTNHEECVGSELMDHFSTSLLLQSYFGAYDNHFKRWLLHFNHVRQSVLGMLYSHSLSALTIVKMLKDYNDISRGPRGRITSMAGQDDGLPVDKQICSRSKSSRNATEIV